MFVITCLPSLSLRRLATRCCCCLGGEQPSSCGYGHYLDERYPRQLYSLLKATPVLSMLFKRSSLAAALSILSICLIDGTSAADRENKNNEESVKIK